MISKKKLFFLIVIVVLVFNASHCFAGWLIYNKPVFKGRVIDAETKEPIEGAVVVVDYAKRSLVSGPGGGGTGFILDIKETLTDNNGEFYFSSYTTPLLPQWAEDYAEFIIYKPGYGSFPGQGAMPSGLGLDSIEIFFSKGIGGAGELEGLVNTKAAMIKVTFGIVELPKLKTREERRLSMPGPIFGSEHSDAWYLKKQKLFIDLLNEERRNLGLDEAYKIEEK